MRKWNERPDEVKSLFNPAFCGRVLYATISEYQKKTNHSFPFPLVYLILPLVLPAQIRTQINSRMQLLNWTQSHQELLYNYPKRACDYVDITTETLEFMLHSGYIIITEQGELAKNTSIRSLSKIKNVDPEVSECLLKAEHVGRWFASAGKPETIYACLGVRP